MNKERITSIIKDIERFFTDLDKIKVKDREDLESREKFYAVSMIIFSIVNRAIDLGEEIVSYKKLGLPTRYRDIFYLLKKNRMINTELYEDILDLVHFRNLAAHEYQTFSEEDVFSALEKIGIIRGFVNKVMKVL